MAPRPSTQLSSATDSWLTTAPDDALAALTSPTQLAQVLQKAFHEQVTRIGVHAVVQPAELEPRDRVRLAIQSADLRYRAKHGRPLWRLTDYLDYREEGDPGQDAIYSAYGNWPHALLAARHAEHLHNAARRTRGGNRKDDQFSRPERDRALLVYAEAHAGCLPGKGEYERWQLHRSDMPTYNQIRGRRADNSCDQTWEEAQKASADRALRERHWPLTRLRVLLESAETS